MIPELTKDGERIHGTRRWPVDPVRYAWESVNRTKFPADLRAPAPVPLHGGNQPQANR